jgi:hypothetical protein
MKIIDNVMPSVMEDQLHSMCISKDFAWSFLQDVTWADQASKFTKSSYPSFAHVAIYDKKPSPATPNTVSLISSMLLCISDKAGLDANNLQRVRFGMYLPISNPPLHNNIHVDMFEPHTVCLYYVNDTDGDTFFFDKEKKIVERITPKKGRMVVFDGLTFHASSMPSKNYRITLNMDYVGSN